MNNRILLIRNVDPSFYGGGETYQLMLAECLKKNGLEPVIVTSSKLLIKNAKKNGFECVEAPYNKKQNWSGLSNLFFLNYYLWQRKLKKWYKELYKKYNPTTVNIQSRDDWIAGTSVAKELGIRVLWTDHMDMRSWVLTNVNVWYKNLIGKWIKCHMDDTHKIIMISEYEHEWIKKVIDDKKIQKRIITIKNGAIDKYDDYKKVKPQDGTICFVGRIVGYKGINELIEAFNRVRINRKDIVLNIYGDGEDFITVKNKVRGNKQIVMHGRTDTPLEALARNDIFVLPSYREGLSLSLLDSMMMKKKIIASNVGGNPELIQDKKTGLLVDARNVDELEKAILFMLGNVEKSSEMAEEARRRYEKEYNFDEIFKDKMMPLYTKMI